MALVGAIFVLPVALLVGLLFAQINADVAFDRQEQLGVRYMRALRPLFFDLEAERFARNDAAPRLRTQVDADFASASLIDARQLRPLALTVSLRSLQANWQTNHDAGRTLREYFSFTAAVSDNSNITLDPILDGYYVGDTMVNKIPSLIDGIAQAVPAVERSLRTGRLSAGDRINLTILAGQIDTAAIGIGHNLPIAVASALYLRPQLDRLHGPERTAAASFAPWLAAHLLGTAAPHGSVSEFAGHERLALTTAFALYDGSMAALDDVLRRRIEALVRREFAIAVMVFASIAVAAFLMVLTTRSMSRQLADKAALEHEVLERAHIEQRLAFAAFHDDLTGLPNRAQLLERMVAIVAKRYAGTHHWAILFLDLDRFKLINDSLGHVIGDLVLVEGARRLERCLRAGDTLARSGGDEFIILLDDIEDVAAACEVARRILRAFEAPFNVAGREVFATASIGIATSRNSDDQPEDILRNADIAMYRAKDLGKQRYELFTPDLLKTAVTRLDIETDLVRALARHEFFLVYQPIISAHSSKLTGFEALVRWQHPERGLVEPDSFISIAEENGAIVAIGEWVLREACRQLQAWRASSTAARDLRINVNVSAKQLASPDFAHTVQSALDATGLDPGSLNVEITESVLVGNGDEARATLAELRGMGVHIHLDDFGTGYSSLAYLRDLPIDALKIDRSFVGYSNTNHGSGLASVEIVRTIIALAQSLSLTVTAEGVETNEQREQLRSLGCTNAQGYYFSRPVDAAKAEAIIGAERPEIALAAADRGLGALD